MPNATNSKPAQSDLIVRAAEAVSGGSSLEEIARPFLDLLHRVTGLDSTYLTEVRWDDNEQEIRFSDNRGDMVIPERLVVEWEDTLCRQALSAGKPFTDDALNTFPNSQAARDLGIQTYVSVPVVDSADAVLGTLCGASNQRRNVPPESLAIMELFARLIADQWQRDKLHAAAEQRAAKAESRLRERAMFLAEAEHKLKSPLTILRGWSELLLTEWPAFSDDDRMKAVGTMRTAALQMSDQVDELLDEARSQVLTTQLTLKRVNLSALLQRVRDELAGSSARHSVRCDVSAELHAWADEAAVWQVLWHLGENALKYSPDGGEVALSARPAEMPGHDGDVVVCVRDHGVGIPDDTDIFAPFARGTDVADRIPGTGLGLHIVRNLTQAMNGEVNCARADGGGSEFRVILRTVQC